MPGVPIKMSRYKYELLLAAQLSLSFIAPLFSSTEFSRTIVDLGISLVFLAAIYVVSSTRKHLVIGLVLMLPTLLLIWGIKIAHIERLDMLTLIGSVLFFCYICALILLDIFRTKMVNVDIIAAGISVYLFFGNICGFLYAIIGQLDPNAFNIPEATAAFLGEDILGLSSAMYFSFVTLTTLGYGDITPVNDAARSLAFLEAAMGQIYLTVLIASLVGVHISSIDKGENP
jgi:voltage-gated potassium channel Kch